MRILRHLHRICVPLLLVTSASICMAQDRGVVTGRVSNAGTNAYLDGAVVTLDPGNHSTLTTSTGRDAELLHAQLRDQHPELDRERRKAHRGNRGGIRDLTSDVNGGSAWVRGLEFAYQQQLSDLKLPRFFRPFGVFANFTWLQTEGNYTNPSGVSSASAVPGFTPRSGNIGLSWIAHGWTVRVKAKYEGDRLRVYNANPALRIYVNDNFPVDVNLAYAFNRRLTAFIDVINVFDTRTFDDYQYIEDRPLRTFKFSTYIKAGISGRF